MVFLDAERQDEEERCEPEATRVDRPNQPQREGRREHVFVKVGEDDAA